MVRASRQEQRRAGGCDLAEGGCELGAGGGWAHGGTVELAGEGSIEWLGGRWRRELARAVAVAWRRGG
jgi:hypothetical protein